MTTLLAKLVLILIYFFAVAVFGVSSFVLIYHWRRYGRGPNKAGGRIFIVAERVYLVGGTILAGLSLFTLIILLLRL